MLTTRPPVGAVREGSGRGLVRRRDPVHDGLAERGRHDLQPDRKADPPSSAARPDGTDSAAVPARFVGIVARSLRYMASGSSTLSPIGNAVVGVAGETSTSACSNAAAKSREISVRTFCACP